jgi:membrane protein insertase Oxa1/YidC/SpoIIIJ
MDKDTEQGLGCFGLIVVATWIGFYVRSQQNWGHFWAMMGVEALIIFMALLAIGGLASDNGWYQLLGVIAGIYALSCLIAVGMFLYNGNYEASMKFVTWKWREPAASAPPVAETPAPVELPASEADAGPWAWLLAPNISEYTFISTLNNIWDQTPSQASDTVASLQRVANLAGPLSNKQAIDLLTAVALERTGDGTSANAMYQQIINRNSGDGYAASAKYRLHFVKVPPGKFNLLKLGQWWTQKIQYQNRAKAAQIEAEYTSIMRESDAIGWYLIGDQWQWSTSRKAAIQNMLNRKSDQLSFEFFQYLRAQSPFPKQYSFLYIILFLTLGIKLLALPIYARQAKLAILSPKIQQEVQWLESLYSGNPTQLDVRRNEVYEKYRVEMVSGCIMPVVDLIFVIWAFIAIQGYVPQLALDEARFLWLDNLIERNLWMLVLWAGIYLVNAAITGELQAYGRSSNPNLSDADATTAGCISLAVGIGFWGWVMWSNHISSALVVFWTCLLLISMFLTVILRAIWKMILSIQGVS